MALTPEFREHLIDLFSGIGPIDVRRMFGGAGLYLGDACFAIVLGGERVMMRGDDTLADGFEAEGGERWVYEHKTRGPTAMPYWSLPDSAQRVDGSTCLPGWDELAGGTARGVLGGCFSLLAPLAGGGIGGMLTACSGPAGRHRAALVSQGACRLVYCVGALLLLFVPGLGSMRGRLWLMPGQAAACTPAGYYTLLAATANVSVSVSVQLTIDGFLL